MASTAPTSFKALTKGGLHRYMYKVPYISLSQKKREDHSSRYVSFNIKNVIIMVQVCAYSAGGLRATTILLRNTQHCTSLAALAWAFSQACFHCGCDS